MTKKVDYDTIAATYDRRYEVNDFGGIEESLRGFVHGDGTPLVLEVGCGTGHWLARFTEWGCRAAGVDASEQMLRLARAGSPGVPVVLGRAERLPWRAGRFDRVVCINALHHFDGKEEFLAEARRVLRSGGRLLSVGLDPHTGLDDWCIYDYFDGALDTDRAKYPPTSTIRARMESLGFVHCHTTEAQRMFLRLPGREALEQGRLERGVTSQLAALSDEVYAEGIARMWRDVKRAEARGDTLRITVDLRLYATVGTVP